MSGQSIGRFAEEAAWARFADALRGLHDARRGLGRYRVVSNSDWSAVGPSYVKLLIAGSARLAIYRDGPQPAVGAFLQAVRTSGDPHAPYLALPLPVPVPGGCAGMLYASAQPVGATNWAIIRCDVAAGYTWQMMGASPVDGTAYPQRAPLVCPDGSRFLTWGSSQDLATPGPLYYSDDHGATWTSCGISVSNVSRLKYGFMFAVGGSNLYLSTDHGATWAAATAPPSGGVLYDVSLNDSSLNYNIAVLSASGVTIGNFSPADGAIDWWSATTGPGGAGWVSAQIFSALYFVSNDPVGTIYSTDGTTSTAEYALGGDTSPAHPRFSFDNQIHVNEEGDIYQASQFGTLLNYDHATDNPSGRADYPTSYYIITGVNPVDAPSVQYCSVVSLNIGAEGPPTFLINPTFGHGLYDDMSARQPTDLGGHYVASGDGLTTTEIWLSNLT